MPVYKDGKVIDEGTKSFSEQAGEKSQVNDIQVQLLDYFHAQGFSEDDKPNISNLPFKATAPERDLAWSTYTLELQTATEEK